MNWWSEAEDVGDTSVPPVDTRLIKRVHKPVSLSLILFLVPLLVKGAFGNIKDEVEFLVWLGGGEEEKRILYLTPRL